MFISFFKYNQYSIQMVLSIHLPNPRFERGFSRILISKYRYDSAEFDFLDLVDNLKLFEFYLMFVKVKLNVKIFIELTLEWIKNGYSHLKKQYSIN